MSPRTASICTRRRVGSRIYTTRLKTRWPDFDGLGHLNHAAYHVFLDEARDDVLRLTVGDFSVWPNVVVHSSIDYHAEITVGTRDVVVESEIASVGRSSVRFKQRVVLDDGTLAADAETVLVAWDRDARTSRPITSDERAALTR
jgi:YbgC/YbaW family acyl-CoA thioester hydrolase